MLYQYIIARWGYSRAIAAWQTITEIDGTCAYENTDAWHQKVNDFFKAHDPFEHLTTASMSGDKYWAAGNEVTDLPQMHAYKSTNSIVMVARDVAHYTRQMWQQVAKPNFIGEFGHAPNDQLQPYHLHNGIWAALASGAAIMPLDWNDGGGWPYMTVDMYRSLSVLADFVANFDLQRMRLRPVEVTVPWGYSAWCMLGEHDGFGWVLKEQLELPSGGQPLTIRVGDASTYGIRFFDTWTGVFGPEQVLTPLEGKLAVPMPAFQRDIAFRVYHIRGEITADDFNDGNAIGWQVVRPAWTVEGGSLKGSAQDSLGALIVTGGQQWRHYTVEATMRLAPRAIAGLVLRLAETGMYEARLSEQGIALAAISSAGRQELAAMASTFAAETWHHLSVRVSGDTLAVQVDADQPLTVADGSFSHGCYGFFVKEGIAYFDDVRILRDAVPPPPPSIISLPLITQADTILIRGRAFDDASYVVVQLNGGVSAMAALTDSLWEIAIGGLRPGVNNLSIWAEDREGNRSDTLSAACTRFQGDLLLFEDFSQPALGGWQAYAGNWQVQEGALVETSAMDKAFIVTGEQGLGDCGVSVRVFMPEPKICFVAFRWRDGNNHYRVRIKNYAAPQEDNIKLERVLNGVVTTLAEVQVDLKPPAWPRWFSCRVEAIGPRLSVIVDELHVLSAVDSAFLSGRVGVGSHRTTNRFDDFVVYRPLASRVRASRYVPWSYRVSASYPNPSNGCITFILELPDVQRVRVVVYNTLGQQVRELLCGRLEAGEHRIVWDGKDDQGRSVGSGVYLFEFVAGDHRTVCKTAITR
jgi:hypothetical protein